LKDAQYERWNAHSTKCPTCNQSVIALTADRNGVAVLDFQVWPKGVARAALPKEVPEKYAADYREACIVLPDSPKASAALSRRCLQLLLREQAGVKPGKLYKEIEEALSSGKFPSYVTDSLAHAVRHFGNFAAHPEKDLNINEVIEVEPGEADWCLDIIDTLFDFYFVQPAKTAERLAKLQGKLKDVGKKP
jgi:hypothetical protein